MKKRILPLSLAILMLLLSACGTATPADSNPESDVTVTGAAGRTRIAKMTRSAEKTSAGQGASSEIQSEKVTYIVTQSATTAPEAAQTVAPTKPTITAAKKDHEWRKHPGDFKLIALTFDDAPCDGKQVRMRYIVDTLNKYEGSGTFFVVGKRLRQYGEGGEASLRYALENGFELGNHTDLHASVKTDDVGKKMTAKQLYNDFNTCQELVKAKFGVTMKWLRPSGLHTNAAVFEATARLGLPVITRSIASGDTDSANTSQDLINNVLTKAFDGGIVLMHSTKQPTADALDTICAQLYAKGYRFVTVSELFEYKGVSYKSIPTDREIGGYTDTFLGSMI